MGFCLQLRLLLWKNYTLKKRKPLVLLFELVIPLVLFFILIGIRKKQPAYPVGSSSFPAFPLPSAGVIAVMQAFCDNGVRDSNGFATFPNSTVTPFLERLKNVSKHHNFFLPGFTLGDLDLIPSIFKTIVEDPVALHDCFAQAPAMRVDYFLKDPDELKDFLATNLSLPSRDLNILFNSSVDMKQVYFSLFGHPFEELAGGPLAFRSSAVEKQQHHSRARQVLSSPSFLPGVQSLSFRHLDFMLKLMRSHPHESALLLTALQWVLDTDRSRPPPKIDPEDAASSLTVSLVSRLLA